ncbi:hypothetical protein C8Q80DRAFT_1053438, partial [Daedaleopsis nitida]
MGGNAFKNLLPDASFPRMPPPVYSTLKARLLPILQELYAHVAISPECPGKADYGDLDFIVSGPREGLTLAEVKDALRATCSVPMEGSRTSNYAVPSSAFEDVVRAARDGTCTPDRALASGDPDGQMFFQVDVNVCADRAQLERTVFYTSYGDLGFILGLLAQTAGLSFNIFGLKLAEPVQSSTSQTFYLSSSMSDILTFFGLSMSRWERGFATQEEIFEWVATSPFVRPLVARYRSAGYRLPTKDRDRVEARAMRQNFVAFLQAMDHDADAAVAAPESGPQSEVQSLFAAPENHRQENIDAALRHFSKYEEHASLLYLGRASARAREVLNGTNVQNWTGVQGMPVRFVMDEVK